MRHRREWLAGFTLLEVMIAVAILALALTAIFSSEAGAIKVHHRARKTSVATLLARCKMAEVEEHVAKEGFPALEEVGTDGCCEDGEVEGYECDWRISVVELPEPGAEDEEGGPLGGLLGGGGEDEEGGASPHGNLPSPQELGESTSMQDVLGGTAAVGGGDMMSQMALSYAWPILKPAIEEQVRRAEVTVKWKEGTSERSFDVVQFLVASPEQLQDTGTEQPDPNFDLGGNEP